MERPTPKPAEEVKAVKARRQQKYKDNRQRVINHLKKRGLSNAAIAGIVGNIDIETGGSFDFQQRQTKSGKAHDPNFIKGGAYGLFQFDDPGKSAGHETWYKQYLEKTNKTDSTESQLDYVLDMVNAGEDTQDPFYNFSTNIGASNAGTIKGYFKISEDPKQVSDSITDRFLNPGVKHSDKRRASAQATFDELQPAEQADIDPDNQNINQAGDIVDTGEGVDPPEFEDERKAGLKDLPLIGRFFAEGGVPMKKQMEMFENGGLMDEGGTVDPVSGNDVPPGSTQEEVRDDIPAQLSEGEFVFPADVVRYIGLGNLMSMRQEAKLGLQVMDKMGQMGNSEEATMPDNLPFDINDLDMADEREYNVGGFVPGTPQQQQYGIAGYQQAMTPTTGFMQQQPVQFGQQQPVQAASQQFVQPMYTAPPQQTAVPTLPQYKKEEIPTFTQTIGQDPGQYDELRLYRNDAGAELRIPFKNGQPIYPIPEGYKFVDPDATKTDVTTVTPTAGQTTATVVEDPTRPEDIGHTPERARIFKRRMDIAKRQLGLPVEGVMEGVGGTFGGYGPESVGKVTGVGLIIGKNGILIDPITMSIHEDSGGIFGSGAKGLDTTPFSDDMLNSLPDGMIDNINNMQLEVRAKALQNYLDDDSTDPDDKAQAVVNWVDKTFEGIFDYDMGGVDPADVAKGQAAADARAAARNRTQQDEDPGEDGSGPSGFDRTVTFGKSKARPYRTSLPETRERKASMDAAVEARATSDAGRAAAQQASMYQQQDDDDGTSNYGSDSRTQQDDDPGESGGTPSQDFSAPPSAIGFGARAKGGLIEKPKPKAKKKMKRGGLASKK